MPGEIRLQKQYQESLRKQRRARDAKPHDERTRRSSAYPAPDLVAASPCGGERTLLQVSPSGHGCAAAALRSVWPCGGCSECAYGCAGARVLGQHSHKLGLTAPQPVN